MATNQWVVSISTTEDIDSNKTDVRAGQRPVTMLNSVARYLEGVAAGAKFGTVDLQASFGAASAPTGAAAALTFSSVAAGEQVAVNGVRFIAVSGTPIRANGEFKAGVSNTADAADFVTTFNQSSLSSSLLASAASGVVTITSQGVGACQNAATVETLGAVASGTITPTSVAAANTFSINGVTFTAEQEMARQTATVSSGNTGDTVVVDGVTFTCVASSPSAWAASTSYSVGNVVSSNGNSYVCVAAGKSDPLYGPSTLGAAVQDGTVFWSSNVFAKGGSDSSTCTNLAAAINACTTVGNHTGGVALKSYLTALASSTTLKLRAVASGTAANALTLTATGGWTATGATLTGGLATSNNKFDYGDTNAQTVAEIVRAIGASTSALVAQQVFATNNTASTLVNVYALASGTEGNCVQLGSGTNIAVSGARLTGGAWAQNWGTQASGQVTISSGSGTETITINGVAITAAWTTSDANTATLLAQNINNSANALVQGLVYASASSNVVTITAVNPGVAGNAISLAASGTGCSVASAWAGGALPTHIVLGGTGVSQSATIAGARLAGGTGLPASGGANANSFTA